MAQSTLGKAVNCFINEYEALKGYLLDGRFEIDNNLEHSIRPTAIGSAGSLLGMRMPAGVALSPPRHQSTKGPHRGARSPAVSQDRSEIQDLMPANCKPRIVNSSRPSNLFVSDLFTRQLHRCIEPRATA